MDPDGKSLSFELEKMCKLDLMDDWVKGIKIDVASNMVFAWDINSICFYALSTRPELDHQLGKIIKRYQEVNNKEDYLTDILLFWDQRDFVTGT